MIPPGLCKVGYTVSANDTGWFRAQIDTPGTCAIELYGDRYGRNPTEVTVYDSSGTKALASGTAPLDVESSYSLAHDFDAAGDYLIKLSAPSDRAAGLVRVVCAPVISA